MKRIGFFLPSVMAIMAIACNLGAVPPSPTPRPTNAITATSAITLPTATIASVSVATLVPTLASGSRNTQPPVVTRVVVATAGVGVCAGNLPSRLIVGGTGRVTPGLDNVIRSQPNRDKTVSKIIGSIPAGGTFTVLAGPQCSNGFAWWQVNYNGVVGWTAEGEGSTYWLEPINGNVLTCDGISPLRIPVGKIGRVWNGGNPMSLQNLPGQQGVQYVGELAPGSTFSVVGGPQCVNSIRYLQVNYAGTTGWLAEVQGSLNPYLLQPATQQGGACPMDTAPNMQVGSNGRVTPGSPNAIRSGAGKTGTSVVGEIPAGSSFLVLGGPVCMDGYRWWNIQYNNITGWTADGEGSTLWIQPVPDNPLCPLFARLVVGGYGRVTPGQPNRVRSNPSMSTGAIVGQIPASDVFDVLDGPRCVNGSRWWYVRYNDITGWTADGEGSTFWLEPYLPG